MKIVGFLTLLIGVETQLISWDFVYWEAPPFIYTNEKGEVVGLIPEMYGHVSKICLIDPPFVPKVNLKNYTHFNKLLFDKSISWNYTDHPELRPANGGKVTWFPVLQMIDEDDKETHETLVVGKQIQRSVFQYDENIAVFALREKISFTYKVYMGFQNSKILFIVALLYILALSILICLLESGKMNGYLKTGRGMSKNIWLHFVSMVTVGYGDIRLWTIPGRFLNIIWMVSSLIIAALLTGTMHDSIQKLHYLDITGKTVAGLRGSVEAMVASSNWNITLIDYGSYEDILDAVRSGEVELGIMNQVSASYYQNKMNEDSSNPKLAIVNQLQIFVPIYMLLSNLPREPELYQTYCYLREVKEGLSEATRKNVPSIKVEKVYYAPMSELFTDLNVYTIYVIKGAVLIIMGIFFDIWFLCRRKDKGLAKLKDNNNTKEPTLEDQKEEFKELMNEVAQIQKEIAAMSEEMIKGRKKRTEDKKFILQQS